MKYDVVGVICAMESEAKGIIGALLSPKEEKIGSLTFYRGNLKQREVVVAVCGIGKVFAAMCAQTMILHYSPRCILNSGVAGSLSPELDILSLAISRDLVQHDMDTSPLGDPVGLISGLNVVYLPAKEEIVSALSRHAQQCAIPSLVGTIASGDQFIAAQAQKDRILSQFSPIACEMEGAAIAQVCYANKVPFCVIRSISDSFAGKNEMDYMEFSALAASRGAEFLISLLSDDTIL